MRQSTFYAHSVPDAPIDQWHGLEEHLTHTALLAAEFAKAFKSSEWGYLAGLWHDLGKYQTDFQRRLRGEKVSVEHSGAGAAHAIAKHRSDALPLAFVIAGHHAGLANTTRSESAAPTPLTQRLAENRLIAAEIASIAPQSLLRQPRPPLPAFLGSTATTQADLKRRFEFWTRFLFSCLTDADYLDTEKAMNRNQALLRPAATTCDGLLPRIEAAIRERQRSAPISSLQAARSAIVDACRDAADRQPGLFSLTAPTGSGKTLASMLFALRHASLHGLRRVIVVLPYTSIIEQNAQVYRDALGEDIVLEHHSNLDPAVEAERKGFELTARHRLASENWDAPVIVTTTVQFFESLFANRSSRCRKLHNIARSVIILDEVQSLPPVFLPTILDALKELTQHYGCTAVLSTATPPALIARPAFPHGLPDVTEIVPDPSRMAETLRRVVYHWPRESVTTWDTLGQRIIQHPRALAIVHLRNDARQLTQTLASLRPEEPVYHLSAAMCARHRSEVLASIRARLRQDMPCRLVSTQLIEAGVDIDFPILFRAMAGLDSIVQAAGRCNREGRATRGDVHIFNAPTQPPPGVLRRGLETMRTIIAAKGGELDPSDPETCLEYFRAFYHVAAGDIMGIQAERAEFNFATVASLFHLIEDSCTADLVVCYGDSEDRLREVMARGPTKAGLRSLQPYIVRVYPQVLADLRRVGAIVELFPGGGLYRMLPQYHHLYDEKYGLILGDTADAARLIV